jgi:hypothetical protein
VRQGELKPSWVARFGLVGDAVFLPHVCFSGPLAAKRGILTPGFVIAMGFSAVATQV